MVFFIDFWVRVLSAPRTANYEAYAYTPGAAAPGKYQIHSLALKSSYLRLDRVD